MALGLQCSSYGKWALVVWRHVESSQTRYWIHVAVLTGRFLSTIPPGKSLLLSLKKNSICCIICFLWCILTVFFFFFFLWWPLHLLLHAGIPQKKWSSYHGQQKSLKVLDAISKMTQRSLFVSKADHSISQLSKSMPEPVMLCSQRLSINILPTARMSLLKS